MAALRTVSLPPAPETARPAEVAGGFRLGRPARTVILSIAGLFFIVPILASARYAFEGAAGTWTLSAVERVFSDSSLWPALRTSLEVAAGCTAITLVLLVPTAVWVRLRVPHLCRVIEGLTLLPLVVPAVVLVLGIYGAFASLPSAIVSTPVILALEYVVLALPYSYRAIDAGVQSIDLHTLVDASRSLGANWAKTYFLALLPNLRKAITSAAFLTVAYCLGEFAVANLLTMNTFPTWLFQVGTEEPAEAVALSFLALVITWVVLLLLSGIGVRRHRRLTGYGEVFPPPGSGALAAVLGGEMGPGAAPGPGRNRGAP